MKKLSKENKLFLIEFVVVLITFGVVLLISHVFKVQVGDLLFYALASVFLIIDMLFAGFYFFKCDIGITSNSIFSLKGIKAYIFFCVPLVAARIYWTVMLKLF